MGYIILNTDRDDEMKGLRSNMRRMMGYGNSYPYMRHKDSEHDEEKMYEHGYRHGWEDADDEHYRRERDSKGRYV